ncbi:MAG: hypothetical protein IJF07_08090 [Lachnospiraceae bacterium]|nr:hypothetical protein [Lachnospiraceae bacterium]
MDEKRNAILTIGIICAIILVFTGADFWKEDRKYSETENRMLAARPKFSTEELLHGSYTEDYEEYVTDQFVSRDKWIGIKTKTDMLLQKKTINGVYLGKDDYLIEQHKPLDYSRELENSKLASLKKLVKKWDAKVMLVPTADNVITDKLPAYAIAYDEAAFLERVKTEIGEANYIDVYAALMEHREEEIYYRTDHHWTSLGAYYGFLEWAGTVKTAPYPYSMDKMATVSEDFKGTLHSKVNVSVKPDSIAYFKETMLRPVKVTYDRQKSTNSLYEESYLDTKNQYGFFIDDNHALIEIDTSYNTGKTLFVIKDSYANCMIPLLTPHYNKIYVVDLRYYNGRLFDLMESVKPDTGMDVLVLYNCIHFLEDFKYY